MTFQNKKYDIDVTVFGSSRPQLIPSMWEWFRKMVIFRGKMRVLWNEDCVFPGQSEKVIKIVQKMKDVDKFFVRKPKIGLGRSMDEVFKHVKSKYILYLQEDWIFERPIDLDRIIWTMDENPEINCIFFHKIQNRRSLNGIAQPEFNYDGLRLCLYHGWPFLPGVWRMSKVRKHWEMREHRPEGNFTQQLGTHEQRSNVKYLRNNVGCYMYGPHGDWRYVRHIGNDWRMADWRLEGRNLKSPGGRHNARTMDFAYMAPWTSYPICDVRNPNDDQKEIEEMVR